MSESPNAPSLHHSNTPGPVMPMTSIGGIEVSRVICGSNTFFGFSHFSSARDAWLKRYFDIPKIVEVMAKCAEFGVNCVLSGPDPKMYQAIQDLERQTGHHMVWLCTPWAQGADISDGVKWCADHGAEICMPHTGWTDPRLNMARGCIEELEPVLEQIRSLGMKTGLSTHRPECIVVGDSAGYDIDAAPAFWERVAAVDEKDPFLRTYFLDSHPDPLERMIRLKKVAKYFKAGRAAEVFLPSAHLNRQPPRE